MCVAARYPARVVTVTWHDMGVVYVGSKFVFMGANGKGPVKMATEFVSMA